MKRSFLVNFKTEKDHLAFLSWITAWESDNKVHSKIRFVRADGLFSRWTLRCSDGNLVELLNSVSAFNASAFGLTSP